MPNLSITEYRRLGHDIGGSLIPAGLEPSLRVQNVVFSTTPANSMVFLPKTRFIRVVPDVDVRLRFYEEGQTGSVSLGDMLIVAGQTEFFCVESGLFIAVRSLV